MLKKQLRKPAQETIEVRQLKRHCTYNDNEDSDESLLECAEDTDELEVEVTTESPTIAMEYDIKLDKYDPDTDSITILQDILKIVQATNENVKKLQDANLELMYQVQSLRKENIKLCSQVSSRVESSVDGNTNYMPKSPFTTIPQLLSYEQKIKDSTAICKSLESELCKVLIDDPGKFIRTAWKKFFTDELANQYSWRGSHGKRTVRYLGITGVIRGAFNRKFNFSEKRFDFCTVRWFQTANDRLKYKIKHEKCKKETAS